MEIIPTLNFEFHLPSASEAIEGAIHGLADIVEHYDFDANDIVQGRVTNFVTGELFHSNSNLTSKEILKVANGAKIANYFDGYVNWCEAALKVTKIHNMYFQTFPVVSIQIIFSYLNCNRVTITSVKPPETSQISHLFQKLF